MKNNQTQHQKIIEMCQDGNFHCQNEFRALFIFSPHKRRMEIARELNPIHLDKSAYALTWEERKCEHGVRGQKDYLFISAFAPEKKDTYQVYDLNGKIERTLVFSK